MSSKLAILLVAGVAALRAQPVPGGNSVKINLPPDSPLTLISTDLGDSHVKRKSVV